MSEGKKGLGDLQVMSSRFKEKEQRSNTTTKQGNAEKKKEESASQKKTELEEVHNITICIKIYVCSFR